MSTDETRGTRGPYAKTAGVRRRIIEACLEVFTESGYRATTMKAVAERAGISQRGLVHHFASKEELLAAVLEARDQADGREMPALGHSEGVRAALGRHLENMRRARLLELHTVLSAESVSPEHPANQYYADRYAELRFYLSAAFDALREQGRVRTSADSATLAAMVIGLMDGLQVQWLFEHDSVDVEHAFDVFFDSIGVDLDEPSPKPASAPTRQG
jgi:AcrR family transcriptional regulator